MHVLELHYSCFFSKHLKFYTTFPRYFPQRQGNIFLLLVAENVHMNTLGVGGNIFQNLMFQLVSL